MPCSQTAPNSHEAELALTQRAVIIGTEVNLQEAVHIRSLVLAGGESSRMGTDKALLSYHGIPQVRHIERMLREAAPPTCVSVSRGQMGNAGFQGLDLLCDPTEGIGPLAGLLAAFEHDPRSAWLVVAVDLPWIERGTLDRLLAARDPTLFATCYKIPGTDRPEPVCAIYEPMIFPHLQRAAQQRRYSLMLLRDLPIRLVEPAHEFELFGVNDQAEYELAEQRRRESPMPASESKRTEVSRYLSRPDVEK